MIWTGPAPVAIDGEALIAEINVAVGTALSLAGGVRPPVAISADGSLSIDLPDGLTAAQKTKVGQVVAAHAGQPVARTKARTDAQAAVNALTAKAQQVMAGTGNFTPGDLQKIAALLVLIYGQ